MFVPVSGFACGLVASCSCAGCVFLPYAGAVVCVSFVCPCVCCGSAFWPNAMSGNPNITVNVSILIIPPFLYDSYLPNVPVPPIAQLRADDDEWEGRGMKEEWSDWEKRHRTRRDRESRG